MRIPGTKIRLTQTTLDVAISPSSKYILNHLKATNAVPTWHICEAHVAMTSEVRGSQILLNYLNMKNADGNSIWDEWSFRNPKGAAILWPIVQEAALQELYQCVPDLLRTAADRVDMSDLNRTLKIVCLKAALLQSKVLREKKETENADALASWADILSSDISDEPDVIQLMSDLSTE